MFLEDPDFGTFICTTDLDALAYIFYLWNAFRLTLQNDIRCSDWNRDIALFGDIFDSDIHIMPLARNLRRRKFIDYITFHSGWMGWGVF